MIGAIAYALRALNDDSLPQYHGQQLHGMCFRILEEFSAPLAVHVHDKMSVKPFTSSALEFPGHCVSKNNRRYVSADDVLYWRVTALTDDVLRAFLTVEPGKVLSLGKLQLRVEKRIADSERREDVGLTEPEDMAAECFSLPPPSSLTMNFQSVTTFRSGVNDFPWPLPEFVFGSIADKWAAMNMPGSIDDSLVRKEAKAVFPQDWHGESRKVFLSPKRGAIGFTGRFTYRFDALSDAAKRMMLLLATYAEFSGVGRWTAHGLGQVRISALR